MIDLSFLVKKPCFWAKKVAKNFGKVQEKFGKSSEILETGFSECSEISEIWKFRTFQKLQKNDVQLEIRKSQKTCSDSKTKSNVRLKVRNAGPYLLRLSCQHRCHFGWMQFCLLF